MSQRPSIFSALADKYQQGIATQVSQLINDRQSEDKYLYLDHLNEEFTSYDQWRSDTVSSTIVMADIVALDASLPLRLQDTVERSSGNIPKLGGKYVIGERRLRELLSIMAQGGNNTKLAQTLRDQTVKAIKGVEMSKEAMFLQGLSTGYALMTDEDGSQIRVSYGFKDANRYNYTESWTNSQSKPIEDIERVLTSARSKGIKHQVIFISRSKLYQMRNNDSVKIWASGNRIATDPSYLPRPTEDAVKEAFRSDLGVELIIVDFTAYRQGKNGDKLPFSPWEEENIVFSPTKSLGRIVYTDPAEALAPVENVKYSKANQGTLIGQYHLTDPYSEVTAVQAMVIPVIDEAHTIYILEPEASTTKAKKASQGK